MSAPVATVAKDYVTNQPKGPDPSRGGPPRHCQQLGGAKDFHDAGGLCSPGRWPPDRWSLASGPSWDWLRQKSLKVIFQKLGTEDPKELEREAFRMLREPTMGAPARTRSYKHSYVNSGSRG